MWRYGILYDLRRMTGRLSFNYLRDITANAASFVPRGGTRGPVAFPDGRSRSLYGVACASDRTDAIGSATPFAAWLIKDASDVDNSPPFWRQGAVLQFAVLSMMHPKSFIYKCLLHVCVASLFMADALLFS